LQEKEKAIVLAGLKLFARKGFSSTSIQEIATESGISKGAFYLHFKSKEDLLLAIMKYNFDTIFFNISLYDEKDISPREKFEKQLSAVYGTFIEHKEFFIMLSKEQAIPRNEDIKKLMFGKHHEILLLYRKGLVSVYGQKAEPFAIDLSMILEGLFHSYMRLMLIDQADLDLEELIHFLMKRMDSMVRDFDQSFLNEQKVNKILEKAKLLRKSLDINEVFAQMRNELEGRENKESLEISLDVLGEEVRRDAPRIPVIKGMLSNFKDISAFEKYINEIASYYGIY
jgi:AcrR family transcriptional regulator